MFGLKGSSGDLNGPCFKLNDPRICSSLLKVVSFLLHLTFSLSYVLT